MIERLAIWYLNRRGIVVLPRFFVGIAIGYGTAFLTRHVGHDLWEVTLPRRSPYVAINNTVVVIETPSYVDVLMETEIVDRDGNPATLGG